MRNKLALTIALASFALATALGVGLAGAEPGTPEAPLPQATLPATPPPAATATLPACSNGIDDDGDGLVDLEDPDCHNDPNGTSEAPAPAPAPAPVEAIGAPIEAPAPTAAPSPGLEQGSSLNAGAAKDATGKKVVHNESIGESAGGGGGEANGGVTRPAARRPASSPRPTGASGGSEFLSGGSPTSENPTVTIAPFGPAPIGVPNFVIDSFEIPPFLLPIYQACGTEYGIPWEVLAAINKIETGLRHQPQRLHRRRHGLDAVHPLELGAYGVDANGDGRKDPYNPVDAICAAAHYLKAAGGDKDLYGAIFSYNHADWYVQEVLLYAKGYGKLPTDLVGSLTGLTEGAHFPVAADARYADDISTRAALKRATPGAAQGIRQRRRRDLLVADPPRDQHLRRQGLAGRRRQRRRDPEDPATRRSSASTSSSRTPTATASPTPSSARSSASTARW